MDWSNERYVRNYTRDTADLIAVGWEGRFVFYELLRKVDRAGILDYGGDLAVVPDILRLPPEVFEVALPRLLKRGCVVQRDGVLVLPNFLEAQEASQSDAARKRASRERRRDRTMAGEIPEEKKDPVVYFIRSGDLVKIGYTAVLENRLNDLQVASPIELVVLATTPGGIELEQALHLQFAAFRVRGEWFRLDDDIWSYIKSLHGFGHVRSQPVTFGHSVPSRAVPDLTDLPDEPARARVRDPGVAVPAPLPVPDPVRQAVLAAIVPLHVEIFNRIREALKLEVRPMGVMGDPAERALQVLLHSLPDLASAEADCRHVLAVREAEAMATCSVQYLGASVWQPASFAKARALTVGDVARSRAGPHQRKPGTGYAEPRQDHGGDGTLERCFDPRDLQGT
jgi:hypothetical protein